MVQVELLVFRGSTTSTCLQLILQTMHLLIFIKNFSAISTVERVLKISAESGTVGSFKIITLDYRVSKRISSYSNLKEIKTFAVITSVCICLQY